MKRNDPYGPHFQELRPVVYARNDGLCQFCGIEKSTQAHHACVEYPDHADLREDQLTGLCEGCHELVTSIRKWRWRYGAMPSLVTSVLREYMETAEFKTALSPDKPAGVAEARQYESRPMQSNERQPVSLPSSQQQPQRKMHRSKYE